MNLSEESQETQLAINIESINSLSVASSTARQTVPSFLLRIEFIHDVLGDKPATVKHLGYLLT